MGERRWVKRFTQHGRPGSYLRVVAAGEVGAGDEVSIIYRPPHDITIAEAFHAWMVQPKLLGRLLDAEGVSDRLKDEVRARLARH
jgi:MOSC domain-containing protein YiiM